MVHRTHRVISVDARAFGDVCGHGSPQNNRRSSDPRHLAHEPNGGERRKSATQIRHWDLTLVAGVPRCQSDRCRLSTRNRNVPVLSEIEMSPFRKSETGTLPCGRSWKTALWFSKPRWARSGRPRRRQRPRALQGAVARCRSRAWSAARVFRRHGWSALGRAGRCGALKSGGCRAGGVGFTGAAISVHCIGRPR
jgi:hypothetical protein